MVLQNHQHNRHNFISIILSALLFLAVQASITPTAAQSIIRDSEIEATLKTWLKPLLKSANMSEGDVRIILVASDQVNAFVAGGRNIFLYTGLILEPEMASEVIGVMAHELGHIEGGHLVRMRAELETASYQSMLAGILGIGIAALGGQPEIGSAIYSGGASAAGKQFLKHSRTQESAADQAALKYMESAGLSPKGLLSFMQKLEGQELISSQYQNEYMRTHPVTRDRVQAMRAGLGRSSYATKELPDKWQEDFLRMKAKIRAYTTPSQAMSIYVRQRDTVVGQYALAIIDYRQGRLGAAQEKMAALLVKEPSNPYFHEFNGQILREDQQIDAAIKSYTKAVNLAPEASLIRIDLAKALSEKAGRNNVKLLQDALDHLNRARQTERQTPSLYRLAATIYGRMGENGLAQLYLAEEAVLKGDMGEARMFARRAQAALREDDGETPKKESKITQGAWLRVQDILQYLDNKKDSK